MCIPEIGNSGNSHTGNGSGRWDTEWVTIRQQEVRPGHRPAGLMCVTERLQWAHNEGEVGAMLSLFLVGVELLSASMKFWGNLANLITLGM